MSSKELKKKDEYFGIYFNYPTLLGLKMIKKFMEENGFSSPQVSSYYICCLEDSQGHFKENPGGLDESIEFYGPNSKIDASAEIYSENDNEHYRIKFKTEMFGDKDTLRIIYEGDESALNIWHGGILTSSYDKKLEVVCEEKNGHCTICGAVFPEGDDFCTNGHQIGEKYNPPNSTE